MKFLLKAALVLLVSLVFWSYITNTAPDRGHFDVASTVGTMRQCSIHGENMPITIGYNVGVDKQVNIFIPFYGCIANDPTPQYIRLPGMKIAVTTWFKGWHKVEMISLRLK